MSEHDAELENKMGPFWNHSYEESMKIHGLWRSVGRFDAVLSHHMNPHTCGVAKFNAILARKLGVPLRPLWTFNAERPSAGPSHRTLVSIKAGEIGNGWENVVPQDCTLLLHDRPDVGRCTKPFRILYADEIGCPSTLDGDPTRGVYRVLTFGMAHKLNLPHFEALKARLDREHPDYTVELSTAVHEGSPWDEGIEASIRSLRSVFGSHLRVLGFLGDDALAREMDACDAVALYYLPALRKNNTTYWAAVDAGKTIYTNRDADSPKEGDRLTWDSVLRELLHA